MFRARGPAIPLDRFRIVPRHTPASLIHPAEVILRGRVALLYVIEPSELQHWRAIEDLAREERREEAEQLMHRLCEEISPIAGSMPIVYIREGVRRDELLALINEEPSISILVLAAGTGPEGPGPLISYLTGKPAARLRVPITIVPGSATMEQLDSIS